MKQHDLSDRVGLLEQIVYGNFPQTVHARKILIVETVQDLVCKEYAVTKEFMLGEKRKAYIVWVRHVAMCLAYEMSGLSSTQLAPLFNRDDHGTILHAQRQVETREMGDIKIRRELNRIRSRINERLHLNDPK